MAMGANQSDNNEDVSKSGSEFASNEFNFSNFNLKSPEIEYEKTNNKDKFKTQNKNVDNKTILKNNEKIRDSSSITTIKTNDCVNKNEIDVDNKATENEFYDDNTEEKNAELDYLIDSAIEDIELNDMILQGSEDKENFTSSVNANKGMLDDYHSETKILLSNDSINKPDVFSGEDSMMSITEEILNKLNISDMTLENESCKHENANKKNIINSISGRTFKSKKDTASQNLEDKESFFCCQKVNNIHKDNMQSFNGKNSPDEFSRPDLPPKININKKSNDIDYNKTFDMNTDEKIIENKSSFITYVDLETNNFETSTPVKREATGKSKKKLRAVRARTIAGVPPSVLELEFPSDKLHLTCFPLEEEPSEYFSTSSLEKIGQESINEKIKIKNKERNKLSGSFRNLSIKLSNLFSFGTNDVINDLKKNDVKFDDLQKDQCFNLNDEDEFVKNKEKKPSCSYENLSKNTKVKKHKLQRSKSLNLGNNKNKTAEREDDKTNESLNIGKKENINLNNKEIRLQRSKSLNLGMVAPYYEE